MSFRRSWRQREVSRARRKAGPLRAIRVPRVLDPVCGAVSPRNGWRCEPWVLDPVCGAVSPRNGWRCEPWVLDPICGAVGPRNGDSRTLGSRPRMRRCQPAEWRFAYPGFSTPYAALRARGMAIRVPWVLDPVCGAAGPRNAVSENSAKTKHGTRKTVGPRRIDRKSRVVDSPHF